MRGWMNSISTDRRRKGLAQALASARDEVRTKGRRATAEPLAPESFYVGPHELAPLSSFETGVAPALIHHLKEQGLHELSGVVEPLTVFGRGRAGRAAKSDEVSENVYAMH